MNIELKILDPRIGTRWQLPTFATEGSAAVDLIAVTSIATVLKPNETLKIGTGIAISIGDPKLAGIILPRSGLGSKGIVLANTVGLIDSDYQGELIVNLWNRSQEPFTITPGERIAQLLFIPIARPVMKLVSEFSIKTARGEGGFGSTGVH